jgi:hypothetical protein
MIGRLHTAATEPARPLSPGRTAARRHSTPELAREADFAGRRLHAASTRRRIAKLGSHFSLSGAM